jgi:hypothetical protein
MTPDDLRLLSMQEALTENRPADSCWINNEILVVAGVHPVSGQAAWLR